MNKILPFNNKDLDQLWSKIDPCLYNLILSTICNNCYTKGWYKYLAEYSSCCLEDILEELKDITVDPDIKELSYFVLYVQDKEKEEITEFIFRCNNCQSAKLYYWQKLDLEEILGPVLFNELKKSIIYYEQNNKKLIHSYYIKSDESLLYKDK